METKYPASGKQVALTSSPIFLYKEIRWFCGILTFLVIHSFPSFSCPSAAQESISGDESRDLDERMVKG